MQLALTFDDVDHLVVHVTVIGRAPGRDHAEELRDVHGSDFFVDEVPELPIAPCRKRRPVRVTDRSPFRVMAVVITLGSADRKDDELIRPRVVELEGLARRDERAGVGLELVLTPVDEKGAASGDDEENLLDSVQATGLRAPRCTANEPLFEPLGARAAVDRHPHGGGVVGLGATLHSLLGDNEAAHHSTAPELTSACRSRRSPGRVPDPHGDSRTAHRRREPRVAQRPTETTRLRCSSSRAAWPGGTTSVVIGVQTIAGPGTTLPGRTRSKS